MALPRLRCLTAALLIAGIGLGLTGCADSAPPPPPVMDTHPALSAPPLRGY